MRITIPSFNQRQLIRKTIPQSYKFLPSPYQFPEPDPNRLSSPDVIASCSNCCEENFPTNKQIDLTHPLNNTKAVHWKHVLIHSNVSAKQWGSKVELMPNELISEFSRLKRNIVDAHYPVLISNIELAKPKDIKLTKDESLVLVYPENKYYKVRPCQVETFMKETLHPQTSDMVSSFDAIDHENELLLICGHAKRDIRCGVISDFLLTEFKHNLQSRELLDNTDASSSSSSSGRMKVGLISHIGGHAYAGNVLYFDKQGLSLWYGRVGPQHVDSIVEETVLQKNIITDLYRGKIPSDSE